MPNHILNKLPNNFDTPLPEFNPDGVLDPGDYAPTLTEFEARFVDYGDFVQRRLIYDGWNKHRDHLLLAGLPASSRQVLNGSYITSKASPGDIDIAVEVQVAGLNDPLFSKNHPVVKLLQGPSTKVPYHCDAYPIFCLPSNHPEYQRVTEKSVRYWTKWFGHARSNAPKGRVWATTGGFP
jgi:hypothetical protein